MSAPQQFATEPLPGLELLDRSPAARLCSVARQWGRPSPIVIFLPVSARNQSAEAGISR